MINEELPIEQSIQNVEDIINELIFKNTGLSDRIEALEKERDEWKQKVLDEAKIVQDQGDLTFKIAESFGSEIGEANRLLAECLKLMENVLCAPYPPLPGMALRVSDTMRNLRAHLQKYKPYQKDAGTRGDPTTFRK